MIHHQSQVESLIGQEAKSPAVSIILPFEPKLMDRKTLNINLGLARDIAVKSVSDHYEKDMAAVLEERIIHVFEKLNFDTHKKSVGIFVSALLEKIIYLDFAVEEKIITTESFEIRDLVFAKKDLHKYLVLVIGRRCSKIFIGNTKTFIRIKSNVAEGPEDNFLWQTDHGLTSLLHTFPLPVFVLGGQILISEYQAITQNKSAISSYIPGNFDDASEHILRIALTPFIADWKKLKMTALFRQIDIAASTGNLVNGIYAVHHQLFTASGSKIVVEKNFMHPAATEKKNNTGYTANIRSAYIHDLVDDLIERTLSSGGDVEFVEEGCLKEYGQIVLIQSR